MTEIRIHGRGGQGVVTAAELIAIAAFLDKKESQAFPAFGVERTGAPIEAFARINDKPIKLRQHVYNPNVLIILDPTLLETVDVTDGCNKNTLVIVNTAKLKSEIKINLPKEKIFSIDATKIALDIIGKNLVNTVILGAFSKITGLISLTSLEQAIKEKFSEKGKEIVNKNIEAIKRAYENIKL